MNKITRAEVGRSVLMVKRFTFLHIKLLHCPPGDPAELKVILDDLIDDGYLFFLDDDKYHLTDDIDLRFDLLEEVRVVEKSMWETNCHAGRWDAILHQGM